MSTPSFVYDSAKAILYCQGNWTQHHLNSPPALPSFSDSKKITLSGKLLATLDSSGALLLMQHLKTLEKNYELTVESFTPAQERLFVLIQKYLAQKKSAPSPRPSLSFLPLLGKHTLEGWRTAHIFFSLLGEMAWYVWAWCKKPSRILWRSILRTTELSGYQAIGIVGLLSFLIGVVLAYQMGVQLRTYGANIFIVNLIGLSILREFSPLLTAIIIAGRSGAAFTAEIGTMAINQEIDALRTMGTSPIEYLLLPKVFGLLIALPLLTVWSSFTGILGGMFMAKAMLGIGFMDFLLRFKEVIVVKPFLLGMLKTPFFAAIIASIGCFQGMQVTGSADSVGKHTTQSVVQAIFLIICADAFFSILFSWYRL